MHLGLTVASKRKTPKTPQSTIPRAAGGKFAKGVSGNPGGLPKALGHIKALAREHTQLALDTLVDVCKGDYAPARVAAAVALLDRGWGKPAQALTGADGGPLQVVTRAQLAEMSEPELFARAAAIIALRNEERPS